MIDFTTIQTFPVPASLAVLQSANANLSKENKFITKLLIAVVIGGVIYLGYKHYKKNEKENDYR